MSALATRPILVTGGASFLGQHVVQRLVARGCTRIAVPRSRDYDLIQESDVERLYRDCRPEVVVHLAAVVGGIGASRTNRGRFFCENLVIDAMLMEHARRAEVAKFVAVGTICACPKFTPVPFRGEHLSHARRRVSRSTS